MRISNNEVFSDLTLTNTPSIAHTVYDPVANWNRSELLALKPGSILLQIDDAGADCFSPEEVVLWYKRDGAGDKKDWALVSSLPAIGEIDPNSSNDYLCALPVGSVYVKTDGVDCVTGLWIKVRQECGAGTCADWIPLFFTLTRTGDEVTFDAETNTLNIPVGGVLTDEGDGEYAWLPDDGNVGYSFYIPTFTDNSDGTYTYDPQDGTTPITINTNSGLVIPADISAVRRPWVQVGNGQATNATGVTESVSIFHTGPILRGVSAQGSVGAVGAELSGNNALGGANHNVTGSTNGLVSGSGNSVMNTQNSTVGGGTLNSINGVTDPSIYNCNFIGAGINNSNAGQRSFIGAGNGNSIPNSGMIAFIGSGYQNQSNGLASGVLSGYFNRANGTQSVALGNKANVTHNAAVLINTHLGADPNTATDLFNSAADGEFAVRCAGIRLFTNLAQSAGMTMAAGASAWVAVSDERAKSDISALDTDVLAGYKNLTPVSYTMGEAVGAGITAQNYYESFPFLEKKYVGDMLGVNQAERDGIQDLAIKQLLARVETLEAEVESLKKRRK